MDQTTQELAQADRRVRGARAFLIQFGLGGVLLALVFVGFYCVSVGLGKLSEGADHARRWLTGGLALFALLFILSVVGTFAFMGRNVMDDFRADDFARGKIGPAPRANAAPNAPPFEPGDEPELAPRFVDDMPAVDAPKVIEKKDVAIKRDVNAAKANEPRGQQLNPIGLNQQANLMNVQNPVALAAMDGDEERLLRQQGNYQAVLLRNLGRRVQLPEANDRCVVREYAHQHKTLPDEARRDFAETIYWHSVLVLPGGKAEVRFDLPDSVTRFQVLVHSHAFDGRLGTNRAEIITEKKIAPSR